MRQTRFPDQKGFTLIELLVAAFLILVVAMTAGAVYLGAKRSFDSGAQKMVAQQEATLLARRINRSIRFGSAYHVYLMPSRTDPVLSGDSVAIYDSGGILLDLMEWNSSDNTLVDAAGNRITSLRLQNVVFQPDSTSTRVVRYSFQADDEQGNLVTMASSVAMRN